MKFTTNISELYAWAPSIDSQEQWTDWAQAPFYPSLTNEKGKAVTPALKAIAAMQRRRMSNNSRMAIECVLAATGDYEQGASIPNVFASPQGELHKTMGLLESVREKEPLSPMGFSLSVHNTAAGLYSIHAGNKAPSSSVAAQKDTLFSGFLEAHLMSLQESSPVILVFSEEPLPQSLQEFADASVFPFAFACLVDGAAPLDSALSLSLGSACGEAVSDMPQGLAFLQWHFSRAQQPLKLDAESGIMVLAKA